MKLKLNIMSKVMLATSTMLAVAIVICVVVSSQQSNTHLTEAAKSDLAHLAATARAICQLQAENANAKVKGDLAMARAAFTNLSDNKVSVQGDKLMAGNVTLNGDTRFVDDITQRTGSFCTVFMKQGNKAIRVATSVKDKSGNRAVGTALSDAVYEAVFERGRSFNGRAVVVDDWYVTAYEPLRDARGDVVGALFCGTKEQSPLLRQALLAQKVGATGYIYAIDSEGTLRVHPAKEGSNIINYDFIKEIVAKGPKLSDGEIDWIVYPWINKELGDTQARDKIVAYTYFKDWDWIIGVGSYLDEFTAPIKSARNTMLGLGFVLLVISLVLSYVFARSLCRPMRAMAAAAHGIARGEINHQLNIKSQDEVGALAHSFEELTDYIKYMATAAQDIAKNNLTVEVEPRSEGDILGHAFASMVKNLRAIVGELGNSAMQLVSAATEIASSSEQMSRGAQQQTDQTSQVSSAVEEMTATIVETSKNAGEASGMAKQAANAAKTGAGVVAQTIEGMNRITEVVQTSAKTIQQLADSSDKIGEIIGVIDDIADQTNLLALNAAIEAARAGEQGRGFAVVADEVRKLAERTSSATKEIADMIRGIQRDTEGAVSSMKRGITEVDSGRSLADQAGESLNSILEYAQRVQDMIVQIASASEQQSSASGQIALNIEAIANVTKENAAGVEQAASAAEELSRQADGLNSMVSRFKLTGGNSTILALAKRDHQGYMENLRQTISGAVSLSSWKGVDDHSCRFGKWYYSANSSEFSALPEFQAIADPHRRVHEFANAAVAAHRNGDKARTKEMYDRAFAASREIVAYLDRILERLTTATSV